MAALNYHGNATDARSLITNYPKTTHGDLLQLTKAEQHLADIPPETIHLSVGLEEPTDLIADLDQAFSKIQNPCCKHLQQRL